MSYPRTCFRYDPPQGLSLPAGSRDQSDWLHRPEDRGSFGAVGSACSDEALRGAVRGLAARLVEEDDHGGEACYRRGAWVSIQADVQLMFGPRGTPAVPR